MKSFANILLVLSWIFSLISAFLQLIFLESLPIIFYSLPWEIASWLLLIFVIIIFLYIAKKPVWIFFWEKIRWKKYDSIEKFLMSYSANLYLHKEKYFYKDFFPILENIYKNNYEKTERFLSFIDWNILQEISSSSNNLYRIYSFFIAISKERELNFSEKEFINNLFYTSIQNETSLIHKEIYWNYQEKINLWKWFILNLLFQKENLIFVSKYLIHQPIGFYFEIKDKENTYITYLKFVNHFINESIKINEATNIYYNTHNFSLLEKAFKDIGTHYYYHKNKEIFDEVRNTFRNISRNLIWENIPDSFDSKENEFYKDFIKNKTPFEWDKLESNNFIDLIIEIWYSVIKQYKQADLDDRFDLFDQFLCNYKYTISKYVIKWLNKKFYIWIQKNLQWYHPVVMWYFLELNWHKIFKEENIEDYENIIKLIVNWLYDLKLWKFRGYSIEKYNSNTFTKEYIDKEKERLFKNMFPEENFEYNEEKETITYYYSWKSWYIKWYLKDYRENNKIKIESI
jgi:hypothetical protein